MMLAQWFTKHKHPMPGNKAVPRDHSVSLSGWWHIDHAWQQGGAKRSFSLIVWMMTHRTMSGNKAVPWGHSVSLSGWWHIEPCLATRWCHEVIQSHCLDDGQLDCHKWPPTPIGVIGTFSDTLWEECRTLLLSFLDNYLPDRWLNILNIHNTNASLQTCMSFLVMSCHVTSCHVMSIWLVYVICISSLT